MPTRLKRWLSDAEVPVKASRLGRGTRHRNKRNRSGYTLIEVLVACSILFLLGLLLLAAIQAAREAARRLQCRSNLRQIGIALHAYYTTHNMFTPNYLFTKPHTSSNRYSGFVYLLADLDQRNLYNSVNMDFSRLDSPGRNNPQNSTVFLSRLSVFLCPSDGEPDHLGSYRFNYGRRTQRIPVADGPFSMGFLPSQTTITDGLANTAFLSERVGGSFKLTPGRARDVKWVEWPARHFPPEPVYIDYCLSAGQFAWMPFSGRAWAFNGMENTDYNHNGSPNDQRPSCGGTDYGLQPPRSYHSGVVHVLFGDGRAEAVSDGINPTVWSSIGTATRAD